MSSPKLAIIDFYAGRPNRGRGNIIAAAQALGYEPVLFDLRQNGEMPDIADFRIFVATGGPGNPADTENWGDRYREFVFKLLEYNKNNPENRKYHFAICHSFQVLCEAVLQIGVSSMRPAKQTGIHPQARLPGPLPGVLNDLPPQFNALENRFYQILPNGRQHPDFIPFALCDKALAGITSRDGAIIATQFHPESGPQGADTMLNDPASAELIHSIYGEEALRHMRENTGSVQAAHDLLRNFLRQAMI